IGLSGYSQYYQLTTRPSTLGTQCRYDKIAYANNSWGTYFFAPLLDDLDGLGPGGPVTTSSPIFSFTPPGPPALPASHPTRKWSVGNISGNPTTGDIISKNVGNGAPGGAGTFITISLLPGDYSPAGTRTLNGGTFQYNWYNRVASWGGISIPK